MIEPVQIVHEFDSDSPPNRRPWVEAFLSAEGSGRRYLVNRNPESLRVARALEIEGMVDDTATPGSCRSSHRMHRAEQPPADALVVNLSASIAPVSVRRRLAAVGVAKIHHCDLRRMASEYVSLDDFATDTRSDPDAHAGARGRPTVMSFVPV